MKKSSSLNFHSYLSVLLIFLFTTHYAISQEYNIYELGKTQTSGKSSNIKHGKSDRIEFYDLALKLHPTHYIEKNNVKTKYKTEAPVKLTIEDAQSLEYLQNNSAEYSNIELLIISIQNRSEFNRSIDLSNNKDLKKLKYVYLKCNDTCLETDLINFVKVDNKVRIFYTIENPS